VSETALYVVRVWRETDGFRAAVRRVDDEDTRLFHAAADVARYLEASAPAVDPARIDPASR
jgi:hypothetical protein